MFLGLSQVLSDNKTDNKGVTPGFMEHATKYQVFQGGKHLRAHTTQPAEDWSFQLEMGKEQLSPALKSAVLSTPPP